MSTFPKNFYFGAATSAHQVEGGTQNDWSEWEKKNAARLARTAEQKFGRLVSWSSIKKDVTDPKNYISGKACDHYNRFREDFDIAKQLGHNAHRFSIEWSRVEPEEGKFDEKEIEHYRDVIHSLRDRGMEPFVTLWHWTLPVWLSVKGGVLGKDFQMHFERYARYVIQALPNVRYWMTLNEPEIYAFNSYYRGIWPPQKRGLISFFRATYALNLAHQYAYRALKKNASNIEIGVVVNNSYFESAGGIINDIMKWSTDRVWNWRFLWHVAGEIDFIGLNYYFHNRINYGFNKNENKTVSDMGWEIYPDGLYHVVCDLKRFKKPIYITENGIADARDEQRADFIVQHLQWVKKVLDEGVDVRGYFYWSLLDNFEWDKGFWPRFGLVEVDYSAKGGSPPGADRAASGGKTLERKIRPSAWEYKKIIVRN